MWPNHAASFDSKFLYAHSVSRETESHGEQASDQSYTFHDLVFRC